MVLGIRGRIRSGQNMGRTAITSLSATLMLTACVSADQPPPRPVQKPVPPISRPATVPTPMPGPRPAMPEPARPAVGQPPEGLENLINDQWRLFPGRTGVAIMRIDGGSWVTGKRLNDLLPQQSVSKTWVAMTALDMVDQGKLRLDQKVRITRDDLAVFHQPIRERVIANGQVEETVSSLLEQAIRASDNTANDSLLRTVGGPQAVRSFIARKNLGFIRFGQGERLMQSMIAGVEWRQEYSVGRRFYARARCGPLCAAQGGA